SQGTSETATLLRAMSLSSSQLYDAWLRHVLPPLGTESPGAFLEAHRAELLFKYAQHRIWSRLDAAAGWNQQGAETLHELLDTVESARQKLGDDERLLLELGTNLAAAGNPL